MKKLSFVLAVCFAGFGPLVCRGGLDTVTWNIDTGIAWDVTMSGTGLSYDARIGASIVGWEGTTTSSSGLWQLYSANMCDPSPYGLPPGTLGMENNATITFEDGRNMLTFGYDDFFPIGPVTDGNVFSMGVLNDLGWYGGGTFSITSTPDVNDPSTWTWTAEYFASGPDLTPIPALPALTIQTPPKNVVSQAGSTFTMRLHTKGLAGQTGTVALVGVNGFIYRLGTFNVVNNNDQVAVVASIPANTTSGTYKVFAAVNLTFGWAPGTVTLP